MLAPVLVTPPATMPVSLEEAKTHLRVDHDEEDALIGGLVAAATAHLDGWQGTLGRALVEQTWRQDFDGWHGYGGWHDGRGFCLPLPLGPVISVTSVTTRSPSGTLSTIPSASYALRTDAGGRAVIRFDAGFELPSDLHESAAISVTYVAGYADVPAPIKAAILLLVGNWYENREAVTEGAMSELPMAVNALLSPYRRVGI